MKTLVNREEVVFSPPEPGCVLYLPGTPGGGSKVHDRSPYGATAAMTGAVWVRLASGLWCLSLDGVDDYISLSDWDNDRLGADYTIEQWVRSDNLAVKGYVLGMPVWASGAFYIRTSAASQKLEFSAYGGNEITSDSALSNDAWYHIGVRVISGVAQFFLNGEADGSAGSGNTASNSHTLYIGKGHGENEWEGLIALNRVHGRTLSPLEIRRHFERERHLFGVW